MQRSSASATTMVKFGQIFFMGLGIPLIGTLSIRFLWSDWQWVSPHFHSLVELVGGSLALVLGWHLHRLSHQETYGGYFWLGCGLAGMGILDVFHALVSPGDTFVWLHGTAHCLGGVLFSLAGARIGVSNKNRRTQIFVLVVAGSVGLGQYSIAQPSIIPTMVVQEGFTPLAQVLHIVGSLGFLGAAYRFTWDYLTTSTRDRRLFAVLCLLFGAAGITFELSELWDATWWWWHGLRLVAYGSGIQCVLSLASESGIRSQAAGVNAKHETGFPTTRLDLPFFALRAPILIIAIAVLMLFLGGTTLYLVERNIMMEQGTILAATATSLGKSLDRILFERYSNLKLMAEATVFQTTNTDAMVENLQEVQNAYQGYAWLGVADSKGRIIAATLPSTIGQDLSDTSLFKTVQAHGTLQVQDARPRKELEGLLAIRFAVPIQTDDPGFQQRSSFKGAVFCDMNLSYLTEEFDLQTSLYLQQHPNASPVEWQLLRKDGLVMVDSVLREQGVVNLQVLGLPSALVVGTGEAGYLVEQHRRRNIPVLTGYTKLSGFSEFPGFNWGLLLRRDISDILEPIRVLQWKLSAAGVLVFGPLLGMLLWSTSRLQTAQKMIVEAVEMIKRSEEQFRTIVEGSPSGMLMVNQLGRITLVNTLVEQMFQYGRDELIGQPIERLVPGGFRPHRPQPHKTFEADSDLWSSETSRDLYGQRRDGTQFPIEIGLNPLTTDEGMFILASVIDITQRKEAEDALLRLSRHTSLILSSAAEGIYGLDLNGNTTFVNPAAASMLGYAPEELIGVAMHATMHHTKPDGSPYPREECPMYMAFKDGTVHRADDELLWRKDGTSFPVEYTSTPIRNEQGGSLGAVVTFRDITERKLAERALEERNAELVRSNAELDDFAYITSHDLKEPLRGIHNYSKILVEDHSDQLDEQARHRCETVIRLCQRLEDFLDSLLYFSRVGRTELAVRPTDVQQTLDEILDSLKIRLQEYGVSIRIPRPLPMISCDGVRLGEIFRNLISNAMKYNDKSDKWIEIGYLDERNTGDGETDDRPEVPVFFVRDNGIGIREKHINTIFRIFKRLHGRDKFGGGTGAGLTITKKLVERHGGRLWAESTYGEGTTFFFTLREGLRNGFCAQSASSLGRR